jgi:hypothetical protein
MIIVLLRFIFVANRLHIRIGYRTTSKRATGASAAGEEGPVRRPGPAGGERAEPRRGSGLGGRHAARVAARLARAPAPSAEHSCALAGAPTRLQVYLTFLNRRNITKVSLIRHRIPKATSTLVTFPRTLPRNHYKDDEITGSCSVQPIPNTV